MLRQLKREDKCAGHPGGLAHAFISFSNKEGATVSGDTHRLPPIAINLRKNRSEIHKNI
jgi:hypothetical protein